LRGKVSVDSAVAAPVFRQVISDLVAAKEPSAIVNMLDALQVIGTAHPELFKNALKPLESLKPNPAITFMATDAQT
jgi:hypothetical protein